MMEVSHTTLIYFGLFFREYDLYLWYQKFQKGNFVCSQDKIVNNNFIVLNALKNTCMLGNPRYIQNAVVFFDYLSTRIFDLRNNAM
mgnify:CR=1 FL=1